MHNHFAVHNHFALPMQPPTRCRQCRQLLDDPNLAVFVGDPENAVSCEYLW